MLGVCDPPNKYMIRGTDIHGIIQGSTAPLQGSYSEDEGKVHSRILEESRALLGAGWEYERKAEVEISGISTKGYWDAVRDRVMCEIKSSTKLWTQRKAEDHGQIWFYAAQAEALGTPFEACLLLSCSTTTGVCIVYELNPTEEQKQSIVNRIQKMYNTLKEENLLEKRIGSKDRLV